MTIPIADALFTKSQQKTLALLYGKPNKKFYTNEIVRWANMGRGTITRELNKLETAGLITMSREGNQHYYQANSLNPIFKELVGIVKKTFGLTDVLKIAVTPISKLIDFAFVYGSIAKGNDTSKSDIDLFVISESLTLTDLISSLTKAEKSLGRVINPTIYTKDQIRKKLSNKSAFITRVSAQTKIWIIGKEDDFRKIK